MNLRLSSRRWWWLGVICGLGLLSAAQGGTFTDADWIRLNRSIPGADNWVRAAVADDNGDLYFGGNFIVAGSVIANRVAKWDGSTWKPLGSGVNGNIRALAVSGTSMYA